MKAVTPPESDETASAWQDDTLVLHGDAGLDSDCAVAPPIHYSATFRADTAAEFAEMANTPRPRAFYTRYGNPVHKRVEAILSKLEGTETAMMMASGMGETSTHALALVSRGDHVLAQRSHKRSKTPH